MDGPVVVIGGGIVGTAIAYQLQMRGAPTMLVERDVEPQGASAFSFASLTSFDEPQRDVYLLKNHGLIGWRQWSKAYGNELGARFPGELRWAGSRESGRHLMQLFERARDRGYPVRLVSDEGFGELEPESHLRDGSVVTFAPEDGQVDVLRAIRALTEAFRDGGGTFVMGRATLMVDGLDVAVRVGADRFEASTVVVAAGAETAALVERLGWDVPMDASPGLLCMTEPLERFLDHTVYVYPADDVPVHLRQLDDGRVLIGERAQDEVAKHPTAEHARMLLRQAGRAFPILRDAKVDHYTVEWRPMPRDGMPIVGPLPGLSSVYLATGHSGVTIAPALARFVSDEILDRTEADRLKAFRPARFASHKADAYRSIEEAFSGSELYLG